MNVKKRELLLVDGYNIIGAWPHLRQLREIDFDQARQLLIEAMAEYQAVSGREVTVVFDAHLRYGRESKETRSRVEVVYTKRTRRPTNGLSAERIRSSMIGSSRYLWRRTILPSNGSFLDKAPCASRRRNC